jgi:hypothetical protein
MDYVFAAHKDGGTRAAKVLIFNVVQSALKIAIITMIPGHLSRRDFSKAAPRIMTGMRSE